MITSEEIDLFYAVLDCVDPASNCAVGNDEIAQARDVVARLVDENLRLHKLINTPDVFAHPEVQDALGVAISPKDKP